MWCLKLYSTILLLVFCLRSVLSARWSRLMCVSCPVQFASKFPNVDDSEIPSSKLQVFNALHIYLTTIRHISISNNALVYLYVLVQCNLYEIVYSSCFKHWASPWSIYNWWLQIALVRLLHKTLMWLCLWSQYVMELSLAFHFSHPIPISEEKWLDFKIIGQKRFTECVVHMLFMI
jgi:hypothetical protein